jgi:hypothetical protein
MDELPLDVLIIIATIVHDRTGVVWRRLMRISDEFDIYARDNAGIRAFIRFATSVPYETCGRKIYFLMRWIHREDDLPAIEEKDGTLAWMRFSSFHREGRKPAVICPCGSKLYLEYGVPTYRMEKHNNKFRYYNKVCYNSPHENVITLQTKNGYITWEDDHVIMNEMDNQLTIFLQQSPYLSSTAL